MSPSNFIYLNPNSIHDKVEGGEAAAEEKFEDSLCGTLTYDACLMNGSYYIIIVVINNTTAPLPRAP